ncbi:MAG: cysteine--tRNA ligase [Candidatus Coatesbacteria bacterium]
MVLYDTLTRAKVELKPGHPDGRFRMYQCGMTVSGEPHIGHARAEIVFDTLRRWLGFRGVSVIHVRNVTDIEDKIINKANEMGLSCEVVVAKYDAIRKELFARLNLLSPTFEPYATAHIPEILALAQKLLDAGLAYASGGDVYYRVRKFPGYGKLSKNTLDDVVAGTRALAGGAAAGTDRKEDPLDFDLWKGAKPGEPSWDSPWGMGRPGWHIECSAMSAKYLGDTFDLHCGATDLIFPHHENEIAQSEGATGRTFARAWAHCGWVTLNKEKMAKSVGNVVPMRDVLDRLPTPALRLLMGQTHWRSPFEWSDVAERQAKETLESLRRQLEVPPTPGTGSGESLQAEAGKRLAAFDAAMDDDLSTPRALAEVFSLATVWGQAKPSVDPVPLARVRADILARLGTLGIEPDAPVEVLPADLSPLLGERAAARKAKDWKRADEIRVVFKARGWTIEDTAQGQVARKL